MERYFAKDPEEKRKVVERHARWLLGDIPYLEDNISKKSERSSYARMLVHEFLAPSMIITHTLGDRHGYFPASSSSS